MTALMVDAGAPALSHDQVIEVALQHLSPSERKDWLISAYSYGLITEEDVALWFYVYDLRGA